MQKFTHPTYEVHHTCGHIVSKQILEATEYKRQAVKKAMGEKKCLECLRTHK